MLTKTDFEKAAEKIADKFVEAKGEETINQLSKKVASDNNLNPEQIRTMVRLANVSVFGKLFQTKTGEDKDIKFETGDPEIVIDALYDDAKTLKVGSAHSDYRRMSRTMDYYGDLYPVKRAEKTAADKNEDETKPIKLGYTKQEMVMQLKRATDRFEMRKKQAEQRWKMDMETAASMFKKVAGLQTVAYFPKFEKNALAANIELTPEVQALRSAVLGDKVASYSQTELEEITNRHVADLRGDDKEMFGYLKQAAAARKDYLECQACLATIKENIAQLT